MNTGFFSSSVSEFLKLGPNKVSEILKEKYFERYQQSPESSHINAWNTSLERLMKVLRGVANKDLIIILEYNLPLSGELIDAVLLGKNMDNKLTGIVIEFKGWKQADRVSETQISYGAGTRIHPDYQLANYLGKLNYSHTASDHYEFLGVVDMYNLKGLESNVNFENKIFYENQLNHFTDFVGSNLVSGITDEERDIFLKGKYTQNNKLFDEIKNNNANIINGSYNALAASGFGLSTEQLDLIKEIESDADAGNEVTYLIQGAPGSGKTLLAINILLSSLNRRKNSILALLNSRLIACLKRVFTGIRTKSGSVETVIKFYATGKTIPGVAENGYNHTHYVVIYDEAQRMNDENIKNCFKRGKVNVIFFDEFQRLNYTEKGKLSNFKLFADKQKKKIKEKVLKGTYRVEGGEDYHNWLERFILNPGEIKNTDSWSRNYEFKIFTDFQSMKDSLIEKRDKKKSKVALVASFTESPGNIKNPTGQDNIRIGKVVKPGSEPYQFLNYNVYWLMKLDEYADFWVEGDCNKLEKCASIYGTQGFEADYIGFMWGRDLVIRNNKWELGNNCLDVAPGLGKNVLKDLFQRAKNGESNIAEIVMLLLKNRLRIFLSRGIKGTYIFCEDEETRQYLKSNFNP